MLTVLDACITRRRVVGRWSAGSYLFLVPDNDSLMLAVDGLIFQSPSIHYT